MSVVTFFKSLIDSHRTDPVYHCKVYKQVGCVHVDGYLCDMTTCTIEVILTIKPNEIKETRK